MEAGGRELTRTDGGRNAGSSPWRGTALVVLGCLLVAACFVVPQLPRLPAEELIKTSAWGLAVLASFAGWGTLIADQCWPRERVGLALRAVWGASAFAFVGGLAAMVSGLSRVFMWIWLIFGAVVLARAWLSSRAAIEREVRARLRASRLNVPLALVALFLAAAVAVHYLGGASDVTSNPYDDDVVYYPFAKQLLERGTLIDPFSFRRMSTLGGQALYHAVLLLRVLPLHLNVFERGMCFVLAVGLLASHRVRGRKVPILARMLSIAFLVLLPNTSINSASYYSGLVFFLALFQTLERLPDEPLAAPGSAIRRLLPLALVSAATCTLRQNYQLAVGLVLVLSYGLAALRLRKRALRPVLVEATLCVALVGALVLPWLVLLYRSSDTILFPIMQGTFRAGVDTQSKTMTTLGFIRFFSEIWLRPVPIVALPIFMLVGLSVREASARRPLAAQWLACFVSIVVLCRAFSLADFDNLARYSYGFATASALLTWHAVATQAAAPRRASLFNTLAPVALLAAALIGTLLDADNRPRSRKMIATRLSDTDEMLRRTAPLQREPPAAAAYHRLQSKTPAGARLLVMLDEPYFLDYARNEIWNLDMPGTASPQPGIPAFQGPEPVAAYLRAQGVRHLAFVEPERSVYLYRHDIWFEHLYDPDEIWRIYAPYMVDVMKNLVELAKTRAHLHDENGMILLDLEVMQ